MPTPNPLGPSDSHTSSHSSGRLNLNPQERSISLRLSFVFALRMWGLFIVLPILAPYVQSLPMGWPTVFHSAPSASQSAMAVGLAMGAYGLTQAFLYIPYGLASDRWGRKPLISLGLVIFIIGSLWAALADTQIELILARALQGMGAVSSVVVAMVADTTRPQVRTRAMAMVGMSIALTFAVSLILAPVLLNWIGMPGIFVLISALSLTALWVVWTIPEPGVWAPALAAADSHPQVSVLNLTTPSSPSPNVRLTARQALRTVLKDAQLWRLNVGVFILHAIQMAMWVAIPAELHRLHLSANDSALLYLCVILLSMLLMVPMIIRAEKYHRMFQTMRVALGLIVLAQLLLTSQNAGVVWIGVALLLFFTGFNVLEATQPSLLSKITHPATKGAASGVYNTIQALGLFVGAMIGAWLNVHWGLQGLFGGTACLGIVGLMVHQLRGRTTN